MIGYSEWYPITYFYYNQQNNDFIKTLPYKPIWTNDLQINIVDQTIFLTWTKQN